MSNQTPNQDCHCPRAQHFHGTRNNYLTHACRCTPCTQAATRDRDRHRRRKAYGRPHPHKVDPTRARKHAQQLIRNGMSIAEIARAANLSHPSISRILGTRKTPPAAHIINTTEQAILAITQTPTPSEGLTNATGTIRRLQALATIGYPFQQQGRLAGIHEDQARHILEQQQVTTRTAEAIKNLYNRLQLKPAPPSRQATQAREIARRNGWLPPLCWDEDLIDDPHHHGYPKDVAA